MDSLEHGGNDNGVIENIIIDDDDDDEPIYNSNKQDFTKIYNKYKGFSKTKWKRMRKDELLDIINILKLNVGKYQNKKKSEVIEDIIKTISS